VLLKKTTHSDHRTKNAAHQCKKKMLFLMTEVADFD